MCWGKKGSLHSHTLVPASDLVSGVFRPFRRFGWRRGEPLPASIPGDCSPSAWAVTGSTLAGATNLRAQGIRRLNMTVTQGHTGRSLDEPMHVRAVGTQY
jgi:hypothetical protein